MGRRNYDDDEYDDDEYEDEYDDDEYDDDEYDEDDDDEYDDEDEEEEEELEQVSFQGTLSGEPIDLSSNSRLAQVALAPTKELISDAILRRAEMLRVEPRSNKALVHLVVDTIPYPGASLPTKHAFAITQMLKLLSGLDVNQRKKPQQGGIRAEYEGSDYVLLIDITPIKTGERLTVRIRNFEKEPSRPDEVGFSAKMKNAIRELTSSRSGLILAAGTPGSGVTTTAFAILQSIDSFIYSVYTFADTEGRDITNITPFEIEEGESLPESLERCLRIEADVIYTPPIRSKELAETVFEYTDRIALIAEIASKNALGAISGLVKILGSAEKVTNGLRAIIGQKLIRVLCNECKEPFRPHPKLISQVGLPTETKVLYRPPSYDQFDHEDDDDEEEEEMEPCEHCNGTGYNGRVGLFEMVLMTDGLKEVILKGGKLADLQKQVRKDESPSYKDSGIELIAQGRTSLEELQRIFKAAKS